MTNDGRTAAGKPSFLAGSPRAAGRRPGLDLERVREDFPILARKVHGKRLVYLDNAATTQKPRAVIEAISDFYRTSNANIHRGLHSLSEEATAAYEGTRERVAGFIGAADPRSIVFTRNATEAVNLVAHSWARRNLRAGDEILLTEMEHHANLIPWILLARETGVVLRHVPVRPDGTLDMAALPGLLGPRTRLVAAAWVSNALGTINPIEEICAAARRAGALCLVDGAQSVPHLPADVRSLGCDFLVFSAHKMLGPTGVGVLCGRPEILAEMEPFLGGGDMIREVHFDRATWNDSPWRFEAGTPNIADVAAFPAALDYLDRIGMDEVRDHEKELAAYALGRLRELPFLQIFGPADPERRSGLVSFIDRDLHPHDVASVLDQCGVAVRAGHHCAQPLLRRLGQIATVRASFYIYNGPDDVDALVDGLIEARKYFGLPVS